MVSGEFVALLTIVAVPLMVADEAGVNVMLSVAVWPEPMESPAPTPDATKPVPEMLKFETVTVELPLFVSVTF